MDDLGGLNPEFDIKTVYYLRGAWIVVDCAYDNQVGTPDESEIERFISRARHCTAHGERQLGDDSENKEPQIYHALPSWKNSYNSFEF